MTIQSLVQVLDARKQELYDLLSGLVRIDSQNFGSTGREAAIAEAIANYLSDLGYAPDVYSPDSVPGIQENPDYWPGHNLADRPNVSCVIPGSGLGKRIMLAAHSDTVPVGDPAYWTQDPFSGIQRDGRIYGRGACDDKYGIAAALFLIRVFKEARVTLPFDLVFTAYCDEENGGGNGTLAACLKYPCDDIINLDCKNFEIWASAAGGGVLRASISSQDTVDSCLCLLPGLNLLAEEFQGFRQRRKSELEAHPLYRGTNIPDTSVRFMDIHAGNHSSDLDRGSCLVTFYTTKMQAEIQSELSSMQRSLQEKLEPLGLQFDGFQMQTRFFHFQLTDLNNPVIESLQSAARTVSGRTVNPCGSCLSDLSLFLKYGSKRAFGFGIGRGFDEEGGSHQPNEYIQTDRFIEFTKIVGAALIQLNPPSAC